MPSRDSKHDQQAHRRQSATPLERELSRRKFVQMLGAGGLTLSAGGLLAACGGGDSNTATNAAAGPPVRGATPAERAINGAKALKDKKPITVLFPSGARDQIEPAAIAWRKATGIEVKLVEQPQTDQLQRISQESVAKTGAWDIGVVLPKMVADLVSANAVENLSGYAERYDPEFEEGPNRIIPPLYSAVKFGGDIYAMPTDGDVVVAFARSDLLTDPRRKAAFEDEHGYELAAPTTWKQYEDIARFFHDPSNGVYGAVEIRDNTYGPVFFQCRWCSKADPYAYWFSDDMEPLVNSDEGLAAAEEYVRIGEVMHPDSLNWGFTETYAAWAAGRAAIGLGWPSQVKTANTPELSKIVGDQTSFVLPGSEIDGEVNQKNYQSFGNSYTINSYGEGNKEVAYAFTQYLMDPKIGTELLANSGFFDPYRVSHFTNPELVKQYSPGLMGGDGPLAKDMAVMAPDINLKGATQYGETLARGLSAAYAGQQPVKEAMDGVAQEWDRITDSQGRDEQIEAWGELKQIYPTG